MNKKVDLFKRFLTIVVAFLLIFISTISSNGNAIKKDNIQLKNNVWELVSKDSNDTTPPYTNCTFDPIEPNGENGWYISNVTVELTAADDFSGVKEIRISICGDPEIVIPGNYLQFFFYEDYKDYYVEYWAIDNAGNVEQKNRFYINIDKKAPDFNLMFEVFSKFPSLEYRYNFTALATDETSRMDRVEFFINDDYQCTVFGQGPEYSWIWNPNIYRHIGGFILKPEIDDEFVNFYAICIRAELGWPFPDFYAYGYDKAGNKISDMIHDPSIPWQAFDILLFQTITLPNNYTGYVGRFFIDAIFNPI